MLQLRKRLQHDFTLLNIKYSTLKGSSCCRKNFCWHLQSYGMQIHIKQDCCYFWCSQNFFHTLFSHCVFPTCEVLLKSRLHNDFLKVYQHFMFNIISLLQIKGTVDFDPLNDYDVTPYMLEMQIACLHESV